MIERNKLLIRFADRPRRLTPPTPDQPESSNRSPEAQFRAELMDLYSSLESCGRDPIEE